MSEKQFPLDIFVDNRMQTLFKEHLTDFEMYDQLRQLVYQTRDSQVAIMYATLGCEVAEYDDVIDVLEDCFLDITSETYDVELDRVYLSALVKSWQLEKAQILLNGKYDVYREKGYSSFTLDAISDELATQFDMLQKEETQEKEVLLSKIEQIDNLSYVQQQQIIPQLRILRDDEFVVAAERLLQSVGFHHLLKAYVLEMLLTQKYDAELTVNFYGTLKSVNILSLNQIDDTSFMQQLDNTIERLVFDDNEQLVVSQNAKLYLALSYPFEQELFDNVEQFVLEVLHKHRTNDNANEWLERFEKLIEEMTV